MKGSHGPSGRTSPYSRSNRSWVTSGARSPSASQAGPRTQWRTDSTPSLRKNAPSSKKKIRPSLIRQNAPSISDTPCKATSNKTLALLATMSGLTPLSPFFSELLLGNSKLLMILTALLLLLLNPLFLRINNLLSKIQLLLLKWR